MIEPMQAVHLKRRGLMVWNSLFGGTAGHRRASLYVILVGVLGEIFLFRLASYVVAFSDVRASEQFIAGALTLITYFTAATAITFALSSLYFAKDLDLLFTMPITPRTIIWNRILVQWCVGMGLGVVVTAPFILGFLAVHGQWAALPVALLAVGSWIFIVFTLMTVATIALLRLVPARWVRNAGAIVVVGTGTIVAGVNIVLRLSSFTSAGDFSSLSVAPFSHTFLTAAWSPLEWSVQAILMALSGKGLAGAAVAILTCVAAGSAGTALIAAVEPLYVTGYERTISSATGPSSRKTQSFPFGRRFRIWKTIALKDFIEIRRDASQLAMLILPLIMFALYIGVSTPSIPILHSSWLASLYVATSASLFAAAGLALRGVGGEGTRLWMLRSSPTGPLAIMAAKFAIGFTVTAGLSSLLLWIGVARHSPSLPSYVESTYSLVVIVAGLTGIAVGLGAIWPRLDWTDPRRAVSIWITLGFLGLATCYLGISYVLLGLPFVLPIPQPFGTILAYGGVTLWAAVVGGAFLYAGQARLAAREL